MSDLSEFYKEYGRSLATRLRAIGHIEGQQTRFVFIEDLDSAEEIIAATSTQLKLETNVLVWERISTEQIRTGGRDNYNTRPQGSLAVIRKHEKTARESKAELIDECRRVALKVLALMLRDEQNWESELSQQGIRFEIDGQSGEPTGPLKGGWHGYGFSFEWLAPLDLELTDDDLQ